MHTSGGRGSCMALYSTQSVSCMSALTPPALSMSCCGAVCCGVVCCGAVCCGAAHGPTVLMWHASAASASLPSVLPLWGGAAMSDSVSSTTCMQCMQMLCHVVYGIQPPSRYLLSIVPSTCTQLHEYRACVSSFDSQRQFAQ